MKNGFVPLVIILAFANSAFATTNRYYCKCIDGDVDEILFLDQAHAKAVSTSKINGYSFSAVRDNNYKPRGNISKVRFLGQEKGNARQIVTTSNLLTGADKGYLQIRGNEDGYWSRNYTCFIR